MLPRAPMALNGGVANPTLVGGLCVPAYLVGTFPTAALVARTGGHDVLREGSGNPGASNVVRLMGWKAGLAVMTVDFAKGAAAAAVGLATAGRPGAYALGAAAVVGHVLPATRRLRGGKGVATAGGMLAVLLPWLVGALGVVWFVVARLLRLPSVGSLVASVAFPVTMAALRYPGWEVALVSLLAVLVVIRHAPNVRRLLHGRELRTE